MIFTERKITVRKGKSSIDEPVILYRGDYEVELRFTITESKYRFKSGVNLVDSEKAAHAQLALLAPDGTNVFTEVGRCEDGTAIFVLSKEMIDELSEVGLYSFQIRLFDYYMESRITIPPIEFGIEVREPIAAEDHINAVDDAMVGYSIAKTSVLDEPVPETFDDNGQYNKTDWETGDRISEGKLNKLEDAVYQINQNEINDISELNKKVDSNFNTLNSTKMDNGVKIKSSQLDTSSDANKIKQVNLSSEVKAMMAGNTPINAEVADGGVTAEKYADGSIARAKLDTALGKAVDQTIEDSLSHVFELYNRDYYYANSNVVWYARTFGAIQELELIGFDPSKTYRLRLIARNHSSFNYRFIICQRTDTGWEDVFDTKATFKITENPKGWTYVSHTIDNKTVNMKVDYSVIADGQSLTDGLLGADEGRYIINPKCIKTDLEIPDGSISKAKLDPTLNNTIDRCMEDGLAHVFELYNRDYYNNSTNDIIRYARTFGSVQELELIGFDPSKTYRLRLIARNHSSFNYRFIICQRTNSGWEDVFDTKATFKITENPKGWTYVSHTIGNKTVNMKVDYSQMSNNSSNNDGMLGAEDGRYIINPKCIKKENESSNSGPSDTATYTNKDLTFIKQGTSYKTTFQYDDATELTVELNQLGVNKIIHPRAFYKNGAAWFSISTDWVSPYSKLRAVNNGSTFVGTVGGNHGTDSGSGFPTATSIETKVYADGALVTTDGVTYNADKIIIVTKNHICAGNTISATTGEGRYTVEEVVSYAITKHNMEISVHLTALEDVIFGGYVGPQITTNMFTNGKFHWNDGKVYDVDGVRYDSPTFASGFNSDRVVYTDNVDTLITYVDTSIGLGKRQYVGANPCWYSSVHGKLYGHLVHQDVHVNQGESIYYKCGYSFMPAKDYYVIKLNNKNIYCVDLLQAQPKKYIGITDAAAEIEVIENLNNYIQVDEIVTGSGLGIKSNSWGALKFRLKSE